MSFTDKSKSPFWWGLTSNSVQCEGVAPAADWSVWEKANKAPTSDDGNGFGGEFRDDLGLMSEMGASHVRLTLEWARIEPVKGKTDMDAIDRYRDVLAAADQSGLSAIVTLASTSLPGWFTDDEGGFADEVARERLWTHHVGRCADLFGDSVAGWVPIDDPVGWAIRGYLLGSRPPGRKDTELALDAVEAALEANYSAWLVLSSGKAPVIASYGAPTVFEGDPKARPRVRWWDALLWDSWSSGLTAGELVLPDRPVRIREEWADAFDMIGLAFDHPIAITSEGALTPYPANGERSDNGFAPLPEELGVALRRMAGLAGSRPVLVTANGVATTNDEWREDVLAQTLEEVEAARTDGLNVAGYFHDTAIDGYEWLAGFQTERGLIDRDRNVKLSGETYSSWASRIC
jgi:beta-glucosidase